MMNAANLCPSPKVVHNKVIELTEALNSDVSFQYRAMFPALRKESITTLARFTGADEREIGITRNTSEANCIIVHGLDLKPGDEIIIELAFNENRILTLDKDFGELAVFRGKPHHGIIRIVNFSALQHGRISLDILKKYVKELEHHAIITVERDRVRIRVAEY